MAERTRINRIDELMTRNPTTTTPDATLEAAARILWTDERSFLPVVDSGGRVVGVLTDRDIAMCAYTQGRRLAELDVGTAMVKEPICARTGDHPAVVEELMLANHLHRVPVVDANGVLAGVATLPKVAGATGSRAAEPELAPPLGAVPLARFPSSAKRSDEQRKGH